jgi:hypothetical protein
MGALNLAPTFQKSYDVRNWIVQGGHNHSRDSGKASMKRHRSWDLNIMCIPRGLRNILDALPDAQQNPSRVYNADQNSRPQQTKPLIRKMIQGSRGV